MTKAPIKAIEPAPTGAPPIEPAPILPSTRQDFDPAVLSTNERQTIRDIRSRQRALKEAIRSFAFLTGDTDIGNGFDDKAALLADLAIDRIETAATDRAQTRKAPNAA